MATDDLIGSANAQLKFTRRPSPILPEHRLIYKITQILLMLYYSRAGKSSLLRLHLLNWASKTQQRMQHLRIAVQKRSLSLPTWGFDPAVPIALRYAQAEGLIMQTSTGYQLEEFGRKFIKNVLEDPSIFQVEREGLMEIGKGITEGMVNSVARDWV
ncbi:hypothetical protein [Massilia sp. CCM 8734]|uniref:hypothetical protein n=1 Tax=Massilia sp. CCM 8734 TaxID=2609283 RepID=UPI00141EB99E|nr:hypothetical protein [Massilia sp. CCM 8734]NHZ97365.1 hypothetical protein [Massilia sp. CCM 8734]